MSAPAVWPSLEELDARRDECQAQIEARIERLRARAAQQPTLPTLDVDDDIVVKNLRRRLETYDVDIVRMMAHTLTAMQPRLPMQGGHVWACKCRATGTAPTAYGALRRFNDHVREAVWGA